MNEAKEKAIERYESYYRLLSKKGEYSFTHYQAKECAINEVDLVIEDILNDWCANAPNILETIKFWEQVKIEIEKL